MTKLTKIAEFYLYLKIYHIILFKEENYAQITD
jgi:hypothetical protein